MRTNFKIFTRRTALVHLVLDIQLIFLKYWKNPTQAHSKDVGNQLPLLLLPTRSLIFWCSCSSLFLLRSFCFMIKLISDWLRELNKSKFVWTIPLVAAILLCQLPDMVLLCCNFVGFAFLLNKRISDVSVGFWKYLHQPMFIENFRPCFWTRTVVMVVTKWLITGIGTQKDEKVIAKKATNWDIVGPAVQ